MKNKFPWGKVEDTIDIPIDNRYVISITKYFPYVYVDSIAIKGKFLPFPMDHVEGTNTSWATMESAIIGAIEYVHCGANSHMTEPICKMLEVPFNSALQHVPSKEIDCRDNLRSIRLEIEANERSQSEYLRKAHRSRTRLWFVADDVEFIGFIVDFRITAGGCSIIAQKLDGTVVPNATILREAEYE